MFGLVLARPSPNKLICLLAVFCIRYEVETKFREPHEVKKKSFDLGGNRTHDLRIRSTVTLFTGYSWAQLAL